MADWFDYLVGKLDVPDEDQRQENKRIVKLEKRVDELHKLIEKLTLRQLVVERHLEYTIDTINKLRAKMKESGESKSGILD
ncbi:hypothetical protein TetV_406 [Tetraselmis virus 1]|uniref:Uncharacterized protein n=1 Tax=Tetraselmis virus 1 TaxID=2060617 RepID=A0A2P0VNK8_9VIRU|nr:hypothetical protein QJ968_gp648 [Tetraselmis virus 1]AUF82488.1 hypothetical protein TetV_406 [Tetraselmis virus 1]